ncbi:MAG: hypothetical protein KKC03_14190 [Bacteroidetes bacterium]|nr:hypothetical protein [Bacteroidota bacterium]
MALEAVQLGTPDPNDIIDAKYSVNRFHLCEAAVAAPVVPVDIYSVQDFSTDAPAFQSEADTFQQGGGDESYLDQKGYRYSGRFSLLGGEWAALIAALERQTWTAAGTAALINRFSDYPKLTLERVIRRSDNETHIKSEVYQDLILKPVPKTGAMGTSNLMDVVFYSKHDQFEIPAATYVVLDKWAGDGSTVAFTLSDTPLTLTVLTDKARDDWELANAVYCKVKLAADTTGTRQVAGITLATTTLTFTTAPAAGSEISLLYVASV